MGPSWVAHHSHDRGTCPFHQVSTPQPQGTIYKPGLLHLSLWVPWAGCERLD